METGHGDFWGGEVKKKWGGLVPVVQVSLREIGNAQKKTNQRSTSTPTFQGDWSELFCNQASQEELSDGVVP